MAKKGFGLRGGINDLKPFKVIAEKTLVAGDEGVALQQRMRADQKVGDNTLVTFAAAFAEALLHDAGADGGLLSQRGKANARARQCF